MRNALLLVVSMLWAGVCAAEGFSPALEASARNLMKEAQLGNEAYAIVESLTTEVGPRMPRFYTWWPTVR